MAQLKDGILNPIMHVCTQGGCCEQSFCSCIDMAYLVSVPHEVDVIRGHQEAARGALHQVQKGLVAVAGALQKRPFLILWQ